MALVRVDFARTLGVGVQFCSIKINDVLREFVNDEEAVELEEGKPFEILWRMAGEPRAKLTITCSVGGEVRKTIEDRISGDSARRSAFTFIQL
jgi:hypothetical protein